MHNMIRKTILEQHRCSMAAIPTTLGLYQRRRVEERIRAETARKLTMLDLEIIEENVTTINTEIDSLMSDAAFVKVLKRYNGHSLYGWECACGQDGRLKKIARSVGWTRFSAVIWEARQVHNIWPAR